jgi:hypothetical protein
MAGGGKALDALSQVFQKTKQGKQRGKKHPKHPFFRKHREKKKT